MSALPLKADIDWSTCFSSMIVENLTEPSFKISTRGAVPRMPMVPTGEDGAAHRNRTYELQSIDTRATWHFPKSHHGAIFL